ncbi:MAG: acylphosphatase [Gammaproteobacteria bacterium]|jgi:acylphosphatase
MHSVKGFVSGRVQGVGFRYFVKARADKEKLAGFVRNLADGRVEFFLQGDQPLVELVVGQIRVGPDYSWVTGMLIDAAASDPNLLSFEIRR